MRLTIVGKTREGSSSRTCSLPTTWACPRNGHGLGAGGASEPSRESKRKRPGWGELGRFTLMRQFGGRFGGTRVSPQMVSGLAGVKGAPRNLRAIRLIVDIFKKWLSEA